MQVRFGRLVASMAVVGTVAAASVAFGSNPPARALVLPPVVVSAKSVVTRKADHPEIWAAIHSLEHAREHLDHAAHDFHGHRADAIGAIDAALRQLHICLDYDN